VTSQIGADIALALTVCRRTNTPTTESKQSEEIPRMSASIVPIPRPASIAAPLSAAAVERGQRAELRNIPPLAAARTSTSPIQPRDPPIPPPASVPAAAMQHTAQRNVGSPSVTAAPQLRPMPTQIPRSAIFNAMEQLQGAKRATVAAEASSAAAAVVAPSAVSSSAVPVAAPPAAASLRSAPPVDTAPVLPRISPPISKPAPVPPRTEVKLNTENRRITQPTAASAATTSSDSTDTAADLPRLESVAAVAPAPSTPAPSTAAPAAAAPTSSSARTSEQGGRIPYVRPAPTIEKLHASTPYHAALKIPGVTESDAIEIAEKLYNRQWKCLTPSCKATPRRENCVKCAEKGVKSDRPVETLVRDAWGKLQMNRVLTAGGSFAPAASLTSPHRKRPRSSGAAASEYTDTQFEPNEDTLLGDITDDEDMEDDSSRDGGAAVTAAAFAPSSAVAASAPRSWPVDITPSKRARTMPPAATFRPNTSRNLMKTDASSLFPEVTSLHVIPPARPPPVPSAAAAAAAAASSASTAAGLTNSASAMDKYHSPDHHMNSSSDRRSVLGPDPRSTLTAVGSSDSLETSPSFAGASNAPAAAEMVQYSAALSALTSRVVSPHLSPAVSTAAPQAFSDMSPYSSVSSQRRGFGMLAPPLPSSQAFPPASSAPSSTSQELSIDRFLNKLLTSSDHQESVRDTFRTLLWPEFKRDMMKELREAGWIPPRAEAVPAGAPSNGSSVAAPPSAAAAPSADSVVSYLVQNPARCAALFDPNGASLAPLRQQLDAELVARFQLMSDECVGVMRTQLATEMVDMQEKVEHVFIRQLEQRLRFAETEAHNSVVARDLALAQIESLRVQVNRLSALLAPLVGKTPSNILPPFTGDARAELEQQDRQRRMEGAQRARAQFDARKAAEPAAAAVATAGRASGAVSSNSAAAAAATMHPTTLSIADRCGGAASRSSAVSTKRPVGSLNGALSVKKPLSHQ
jgi:hypothetical protein